jgi:hypothetical protein
VLHLGLMQCPSISSLLVSHGRWLVHRISVIVLEQISWVDARGNTEEYQRRPNYDMCMEDRRSPKDRTTPHVGELTELGNRPRS